MSQQIQQERELRRSSRTRNRKSFSDYFSHDDMFTEHEDDDIEEEDLGEEYKDGSDEDYIQEEACVGDDSSDNDSDKKEVSNKASVEDVNTKFACGLCSNILSDPYIIPACCHRFCCKCIQESIQAGIGPCPTCRDHSVSFESLRRDEMMGRLLARYKMLQDKIQKKHDTQEKRTFETYEAVQEENDDKNKATETRARKRQKRESSKNRLNDLKSRRESQAQIQFASSKKIVVTQKGKKQKERLTFEERLDIMKKYKEKHGHCNIPSTNESMGRFCKYIRQIKLGSAKQGKLATYKLTKERIEQLDELGFTWKFDRSFDFYFSALQSFKEEKGHCNVPARYKSGHCTLGSWVVRIRRMKAGTMQNFKRPEAKLTDARIAKLDALGFKWVATFEDYVRDFKAYKEKHDDINVSTTDKDHIKLRYWVSKIRAVRAGTLQPGKSPSLQLTEERIKELDSIGFKWKGRKTFDEYMDDLCEFKAKNGHCDVPFLYSENKSLGRWVGRIRSKKLGKTVDNGGPDRKLTKERIAQLDEMGFNWRLRM
ncbi:hypothetical protein CTEN210_03637 [Chaetoceros tenuissimus]|uniref:RING-type domain-containing protein n=1 Tax=Chaetoceros tenuissimus TaxID=426638 RepID=A0AAD3H1J0_9STRA|nr:hypothetical protein CTEN210_03637 [Chaetoceros tenuissimus]